MKCPFCNKELIRGKDREFETILEHVENPNMNKYPLRPSFECDCTPEGFWNAQGGYYGWSKDKGIDFVYSHSAIGSWERWQTNTNRISDFIRPFIFWGKYKYDESYKIARFLNKFFEPEFDVTR